VAGTDPGTAGDPAWTFSLEECWEAQSFQSELQLFRCQKWVEIPAKLQLSSAHAERLVMPEYVSRSVPKIPEAAETHVETGRDYWVDFDCWQQLLKVVGHLATVTAEKRDERLEGIACVFTRDQLLRLGL
jgi:hypothetical protein